MAIGQAGSSGTGGYDPGVLTGSVTAGGRPRGYVVRVAFDLRPGRGWCEAICTVPAVWRRARTVEEAVAAVEEAIRDAFPRPPVRKARRRAAGKGKRR